MELLQQLADSGAKVDFTQGLDARFINERNAELLNQLNMSMVHFAFDFMRFEKKITRGLKIAKERLAVDKSSESVYMLTNFDTDIEQDLYRIKKIEEIGFRPDVRIYRKNSLPQRHILRDLQRWCNNRILYNSCDFMDYVPRSDGKTIREIYFGEKEVI